MGTPGAPDPVKLICAIMGQNGAMLEAGLSSLSARFGAVDMVSRAYVFDYSSYYDAELGSSLVKQFASFEILVHPGKLGCIKLATNELEQSIGRSAGESGREVNLDPGYLSGSQLVLATTKNYSHRVYLDKGIYAEVTLVFAHGAFNPLPWTYPDYQTEEALAFFARVRQAYLDRR